MSNPGQGLQKNNAAYLQAKNNSLGAPGSRPRNKTEEMTELIVDQAIEHGPDMTAMALQALKDGMRAREVKMRVDAAKAYLANFHHPSKQIDMNVNEQVTITAASREAEDQMTDEERAKIAAFEQKLIALREEAIIEGVVVGEEHDEPEPAPQSGWDAPQLPPLPPEGRET